jgi:hypothetical protein
MSVTFELAYGRGRFVGYLTIAMGLFIMTMGPFGEPFSWSLVALLALMGLAIVSLGAIIVADAVNNWRVRIEEDALKWEPGFRLRFFAHNPVPWNSVLAGLVRPRGRTILLISTTEGEPRFTLLHPKRTDFDTLCALLEERTPSARWVVSNRSLLELMGTVRGAPPL